MPNSLFLETNHVRISDPAVLNRKGLRLSARETKYSGGQKYTLSLVNTGAESVLIDKIGILFNFPNEKKKKQWRVFIDQGFCGWCGVKRLDALEPDPHVQPIREQRFSDAGPETLPFHRSDLQTVVWDAYNHQAILIGFLRQRFGHNKVDIFPDKTARDIARIEAWQQLGVDLEPGASLQLDPLIVTRGSDPYKMLEAFAAAVQKHHGRTFDDPPIVGMMTWYGYRTAIDENIILQNAKIVGELFEGYPQPMRNIMLLDHGWQEDANWGFWKPDKKRFPHGMKWLSERLKKWNMKLALWYTPFCITENAPNHKTLVPLQALNEEGKPESGECGVWGQLPGHPATNWTITFFDAAKEAVQRKWMTEMAEMKKWGCVYSKLDFFCLKTSYSNRRKLSEGELYAKTWNTFRKAVGQKSHLAPCSCDTNMQLGYCDSVRIGSDIGNAGHWPGAMQAYRYGLSTTAALWYKHRKFWVNDSDSIQIAKGCSLAEARVRATMVALSGGHLMLSEDLSFVDKERIEMIRRLIPPCPRAARPLGLFENPYPEGYPAYWSLSLKTGLGPVTVLAIFNLSEKTQQYEVTPAMLGIIPGKEFLALEWWQYKWLGRFDRKFMIEVPPEDVAVIHAQPTKKVPSLLSVSHHITGGYIVEKAGFNPATGKLSGILAAKPGLPMILFGNQPEDWSLSRQSAFHASESSVGGWQNEVITNSRHTRFEIQFVRIDKQK